MIVVVLPGDPIGKGRPRFRVVKPRSGPSFASVYTDAKTKAYEKALGWQAKIAMRGKSPMAGPLKAVVTASFGVPVSWSNKKRDAALAGTVRPTGKPDIDNVFKTIDAFNGIVFEDDSQVVEVAVTKIYAEVPSLRIEISQVGMPLA